jgi:glycosyltransferase involved in cell wall biosynthesis
MDTPRVSVIVPNYNHAQYLGQRLDSILTQTFRDFELIFLDDASNDGSLQVLDAYAGEDRMQVHINEENSGNPFRQWNNGIALARGEYIWVAESDDYAEPSLLEKLVKALDANPDAGLAYCQSWVVGPNDGDGAKTLLEAPYASFVDSSRWKQDFVNSGTDELKNYLAYKNTIPNASAVLFRKSQLPDGAKAPEDMRLAGDWMFWVGILAKSNLAYLSEPLNYFRAPHSASQRERTKRHGLDLVEGLEVYFFIENAGLLTEPDRRKALRHQLKLWGSLALLRRLAWVTNRTIYQKILAVHPEIRSKSGRAVVVPFLFFFVTAPMRRLPRVVWAYKGLKRGLQSALAGKRGT